MDKVLMKCGHTANSEKIIGDKKIPYCVICDCDEIEDTKPLLEGRFAVCRDCGRVVASDWNLPFFHYLPDSEEKEDRYYCGCKGWD